MTTSTGAAARVAPTEVDRELDLYDGVRAGQRAAFEELASTLQPALGDLARASGVRDPAAAVRHTWEVALAGLDLFAWRSSLRAWIAGVLVGLAAVRDGAPAAVEPPAASQLPRPRPGQRPTDWADLPWGARWGDGTWALLERQVAGLPLRQRQALVLRDRHTWTDRDTSDALGLTVGRYVAVLGAARSALLATLADAVADPLPACDHDRVLVAGSGDVPAGCAACGLLFARWQRVAALLAHPSVPVPPDAGTLRVFRRWRALRRGGMLGHLARVRYRGDEPSATVG